MFAVQKQDNNPLSTESLQEVLLKKLGGDNLAEALDALYEQFEEFPESCFGTAYHPNDPSCKRCRDRIRCLTAMIRS